MAKLVDVNGLKAVVQKINADTKDIRTLLAGKADIIHEHTAADVKFEDGKNLVEKLAEIQARGYATEAYVQEQLQALVGGAPEALDTLKELAAALGDDANFASTMVQELAKKVDKVEGQRLITDEEAAKLAGLQNYDDAALVGRIAALEGIDHSQFLTEHQDISGLATKEEVQAVNAKIGVQAVEGEAPVEATGLYKYVDDKVAAVVEVATEQELIAMYDEVVAGEPQV